jgi:hypothetical protein
MPFGADQYTASVAHIMHLELPAASSSRFRNLSCYLWVCVYDGWHRVVVDVSCLASHDLHSSNTILLGLVGQHGACVCGGGGDGGRDGFVGVNGRVALLAVSMRWYQIGGKFLKTTSMLPPHNNSDPRCDAYACVGKGNCWS